MGNTKTSRIFLSISALVIVSLACSQLGGTPPTETPAPTATNTVEPTATLKPTSTPKPTATPNAVATKKYSEFNSILEDFASKGYIASIKGETFELDDFKEEWAQLRYYNFFPPSQKVETDFVYKGHFKWSTALTSPDLSGCGIVYGLQENGDYYAVFIDKTRIFYVLGRGGRTYQVGKTRGSGYLNYGNPAEADVVIAVKGKSSFVSVDGDVTEYTLSVDQTTQGIMAMSLISGTNRDYGTRCEVTDSMLWTAKK